MSGTQLNATTTVPGSWAYSPAAGTVLAAGAGQTLSVTFTPTDTVTYNSATATVAITVLKATPLITWATPAAISVRDAARRHAVERDRERAPGRSPTRRRAGRCSASAPARRFPRPSRRPSTANYNTASRTVQITVTGTPTTGHNAARANAYDDAWQGGANGWVANAKAILAAGTGQTPGMVLWIGDSLTRDPALGAWAQTRRRQDR